MGSRKDVVAERFPRPRPLEGLAGAAGDLPYLGLTLAARQERAFLEVGISMATAHSPRDQARLMIREDVVVGHKAVVALADRGLAEGRDLRWVTGGRSGNLAADLAFGEDEPLFVFLASGGTVDPDRIAAAEPVVFDPEERLVELPATQGHDGVEVVELPLTEHFVLPAGHWLQLLWANLLGLAPFLWRGLAGRNIAEVGWRIFWACLATGSLNPRRVGAHLNRRGKGCQIHPSAVIEGCWLGDGVTVGANAVLRASVLADGAAVEDLAMVEGCVLGPGARVQRQAMAKFCLLGPRAAAGGDLQLCVLDRDASVKKTAALMDQAFGQEVRVMAGGRLHPVPLGMAGVCLGAGSVVAANVFVAPGRCLPPGIEILPAPETVLRRVPEGLTGRVIIDGGSLRPA